MDENKARYIIVGGGAAGMAAAHATRKHDRYGKIIVLSEESCAPYFRPMIPFIISREKLSGEISMEGCGPYTSTNITVKTNCRVVSVDPAARSVTLRDKTRMEYEKILFATGSSAFIPPKIKGTDTKGVFALRTLADAKAMTKSAEKTRHAVMLGGGLLNLKSAFALLERKITVTLVVYSPEVLSQLMESEDALLIRKALENSGLEIWTQTSAVNISSSKTGVTSVTLSDGKQISCQMVCIGKGVRPNIEFLKGSGIETKGGIIADQYTKCSMPNTFAAGDVAVTHNPVSGEPVSTSLWTNAVEMGHCAGLNMAGIKTAYTGNFGILNAAQVADIPFVSMGEVHTANKDCQVFRYSTQTSFRKLVFNSDCTQLIGAVFVGDITRAGLYRYIIHEKLPVAGLKQQVINHTLNYGHFMSQAKSKRSHICC